ncbi:hypothetical protein B0H16DRAFT_1449904 [Mycena metata]|uniref:Uncharacterized protein n=1 Tax=Mycena metata TaxID=1033252 RepID=A0AAD7NU96_9AGAR|nr:hypothetical protein B0H16DRAFT_1449904 [Mycena metata]
MLEHFPFGFDNHFPGKKKSVIPRTPLNSNGKFHEVSSDRHEKLGKQALDMGDIGLPIYGYKDKWSDTIPFIQFVPDSRTAAAICHLYPDFIETTGGIPIQMTMDKGSEIGWQYAIQDALRHTFAPDIKPEVYPVCRLIKSVHNTIIEAFWRWFKEKMGPNFKAVILVGKDQRIFSTNVEFHLGNWKSSACGGTITVYAPNRTRICLLGTYPQMHLTIHKTLVALIASLRFYKEVGPRDVHLSWFTAEFNELAGNIYKQVGKPIISLETAWDVFEKMLQPMADFWLRISAVQI